MRNAEQKNIEIQKILNDIVKNQYNQNYDIASKLSEIENLKDEILNQNQVKHIPFEATNTSDDKVKFANSIIQDLINNIGSTNKPKKIKKKKSLEEKAIYIAKAIPVNIKLHSMKRDELLNYIQKNNLNINPGPDSGPQFKKKNDLVTEIQNVERLLLS